MINKLRRKFILIAMLSVFLILFSTMAVINISNYVIVENEATLVLKEIHRESEGNNAPTPKSGEKPGKGDVKLRQEHYFYVTFNDVGEIQESNNRQMFIYSLEECNELATKVYKGELQNGKYGNFRYSKGINNKGLTVVSFLDVKKRLDSASSFLLVSSLTSLGAYVLLFLMIVFASRIVIKPSEEAYKKQKRFITNASHELKTPLTVISADIDLIEMDGGKSEWTESIRDQIKRLTDMTNELVALSKIEEVDIHISFGDFSLNEVATKVTNSFLPSFEKAGIAFSYKFAPNISMHGNSRLIEELITIFLDNSLKYTGGSSKSSYFVIDEDKKGHIEMRFSNSINPDDAVDVKQIFDRFYRSPNSQNEGSGVGLSIADEIVKAHKGNIKVERNSSSISFCLTL